MKYRLTIASSGSRDNVMLGIKKLGYSHFFECILCSEDVEKTKPSPMIFEKMLLFESGKISRVAPKANSFDLEAYFLKIIHDYDKERVYPSDLKKIIQWYNILVTQKIIKFDKQIVKRPEDQKKS